MKTKTDKKPEYLVCVPDGSIEHMEASWAKSWINIYDNGGIGYQGHRLPTEAEKADIRKRIVKLKELLKTREDALNVALELMK
jgi:hypothetical protein